MLNHRTYLKSLCKKLLREATEESQNDGNSNVENPFKQGDIALLTEERPMAASAVVYDCHKFIDEITKNFGGDIKNIIHDNILAACNIGKPSWEQYGPEKLPCNGAWQVYMIAGEKGYTKLIREISYELSPTKSLIPDRKMLSPDAINTYRRMSPGEGKPLDDFLDPQTPDPNDDCVTWKLDGIEYATNYETGKPLEPGVDTWARNHPNPSKDPETQRGVKDPKLVSALNKSYEFKGSSGFNLAALKSNNSKTFQIIASILNEPEDSITKSFFSISKKWMYGKMPREL